MTSSDAFAIETGKQTLEVIPNCQRAISLMFDAAGVAMNHQVSVMGPATHEATLRDHLGDIGDLPTVVDDEINDSALVSTDDGGDQFFDRPADATLLLETAALLSVAAEQDRLEPSWHVLASNIQAWHTQHLFRRAHFLRSYLGVDADEFVDATLEQMENDQYLGLYRAMGVPRVGPVEQTAQITNDMKHPEINPASIGYYALYSLPSEATTADGTLGSLLTSCGRDSDYFVESYRRGLTGSGRQRLSWALWAAEVSAKAPVYYSEQVLHDWSNVADKAEEWASSYAGYPDLHWALARSQKTFGDIDKAIAHYDQYIEMVQDARGYIGLAEAWYLKEKSDRWMDVLDSALDCEDYHLTHSNAAARGAFTLMRDGRFDDALPWAEIAAQSYSQRGVTCLRDCLTGLGEFKAAEQLAKQMTERYDATDWYDWCAATGEGDLNAAWNAKKALLLAGDPKKGTEWLAAHALHALVSHDEEGAWLAFDGLRRNPPNDFPAGYAAWATLYSMQLADRRRDTETRDRLLQEMVDEESADTSHRANAGFAVLLQTILDANEFDLAGIRGMTDLDVENAGDWSQAVALNLGYFLQNHGRTDDAIELWKIPARSLNEWNRILSWRWLREAGIDPIHIEDRLFPDVFLRKQIELQETR